MAIRMTLLIVSAIWVTSMEGGMDAVVTARVRSA